MVRVYGIILSVNIECQLNSICLWFYGMHGSLLLVCLFTSTEYVSMLLFTSTKYVSMISFPLSSYLGKLLSKTHQRSEDENIIRRQ